MSQEEFARYEDMAIDGRLIYDEYPAEEYKYFSQLSRLWLQEQARGVVKRDMRGQAGGIQAGVSSQ